VQLYVCLAELTALPYASWLDFGKGKKGGKEKGDGKRRDMKGKGEGKGKGGILCICDFSLRETVP